MNPSTKSRRRTLPILPVEDAPPRRWELHRLDARDAGLLAIAVVVFVTSRLVWLWLSLETSMYWEESYRWIAALEILKHPIQPLFDYQADHYQGARCS